MFQSFFNEVRVHTEVINSPESYRLIRSLWMLHIIFAVELCNNNGRNIDFKWYHHCQWNRYPLWQLGQ